MEFEFSIYIIPLIAASIISGWMAVYAWSRRLNTGTVLLTMLAAAVSEWALGYALEIAGADLPTKIFWGKSQYVGIVLVPLLWVGFAFHHANRARWLTLKTMTWLSIVPAATLILVLTTESHGLVWKDISITKTGGFSALSVSYGYWFWINAIYAYILLVVGTAIVIRSIGRVAGIYRGQAVILLLAVLAPWIGNALYLSGLSPIQNLDLTPFAFTVSVVAFTWGIFGYQLADLSPIARSSVIDEMNSGMIVLDRENRIVDINPRARNILGRTGPEVIGQKAVDVLAAWPDLIQKYADVMEAVDEISIGAEPDRRWYELQLSPLNDRRKELVGRAITITNITDRKRTENLLRENEARYRQIVENASDIIYRTDAHGRFTYANSTALRLMGFTSEKEVLGRHYLDLAAPYHRAELRRFYDRQFIEGETNTYHEFAAIATDGREIWLGQNVQIIKEDGRIIGFQAVARDITELKHMQEALYKARDQALEASKLKSQLLAKVSHELRTPLGGILGFAELLNMNAFGDLNDQQRHAVSQIIDSTNYLTMVINDLLDETQIESRIIKLQFEPFSTSGLLKDVCAAMDVLARQKGLTIATSIAADLPQYLYGDAQRLKQILINLVGNAIKFTKKGGVQIDFMRAGPSHWVMKVSDTGIGIPDEAHAYIFEPFRQVENVLTQTNRGTGLGLSITKQLVDLMDGQIMLDSRIGHGSAFIITLPMSEDAEARHE